MSLRSIFERDPKPKIEGSFGISNSVLPNVVLYRKETQKKDEKKHNRNDLTQNGKKSPQTTNEQITPPRRIKVF